MKELTKLEKLTASSGKAPSIADSLDSLLNSLRDAKQQFQDLDPDEALLSQLNRTIEVRKKEVDERQKEVYSSVARLGKALDKVNHNTSSRTFFTYTEIYRNSRHLCPVIPDFLHLRTLRLL